MLEISPKVQIASELEIEGKATELILDICRKTGSDSYLHGKHSRDYVDFQVLENAGINNYIQDYNPLPYPQLAGDFAANLSILDGLFNCGFEFKKLLLSSSKIYEA